MPTYRYSFISHAHADNALCDPYAQAFARLGVPHYYDRENPQVGHSLSQALQQEIERAGVLIVMVSPASIASFWVNEEIDMFFALMAEDRARKIIPVRVTPCELPPRLKSRWWVDGIGRPVHEVAAEVARALEADAAAAQPAHAAANAGAKFTRIVDWRYQMGDHTTITEAIAAANPGERILVRKGVYEGGLTIDKPLEIVGDGQPGDVEVRASDKDALLFTATQGRVANLTLRQTGKPYGPSGVQIRAGRLELEDCDITSLKESGVLIWDGADPRIRRCRIHDCYENGIQVINGQGVQGVIEDCDICKNHFYGVMIHGGGMPTVRKCRISQNSVGIHVSIGGGGVFEDNDLRDNRQPWYIADDSKDKVTRRGNIE